MNPPVSDSAAFGSPLRFGSLRIISRFREAEAILAFMSGVFVTRVALAVVVFALAITSTSSKARLPVQGNGRGLILVLGFALVATVALVYHAATRHLRFQKRPPSYHLLGGAVLDAFWLTLGYIVTGYAPLPFPPLVILMIGVHGLLLGPGAILVVTIVASLLFGVALVLGTGVQGAQSGTATQVALFTGVGIVSAVVGNRMRAASWTVENLGVLIERLASFQQQLLDALPTGIIVVRESGIADQANLHAIALLGPPAARPDELFQRLSIADPRMESVVLAALRGEGVDSDGVAGAGECALDNGRWIAWRVVVRETPGLGTVRASVLAAPPELGSLSVFSSDKPPLERNAFILLTDLTAEREAAALRSRAERFAAVAELSAGLAHEVRNPIAALRSAAEQLTEDLSTDEDDRRLFAVIIREADRLNTLVSEFLEFARVGGSGIGVYDLAGLVHDAVRVAIRSIQPDKQVLIETDVVPLRVKIDGDLVYRVVSNLLLNAVQFSRPGGVVQVRLTLEGTDRACLQVDDEGPGVPQVIREKIFTPFFTTRPGGTGLGLSIAARAASLVGGTLEVESSPRGGGRFLFTFPVALAQAAHEATNSQTQP